MISSRPAMSRMAATDLGRDAEAELRREARRPQHPQRVVAEGLLRRARRAQDARGEVVQAAVQVDEGVRRPPVGQGRPPSR
jgi:hypothetical protein